MKEELKNIILMGLGAMSLTTEKAKEMKEELLKKGEEVYATGKVKNEELKHDICEKIKQNVTVIIDDNSNELSKEQLKKKIKNMSTEEKEELLTLLTENKE